MRILGNLLIFAPFILNVLAQITCDKLIDMNETNTYYYLEEMLEMDCSMN
jgi:hypothetical protein